MIYIFDKTQAIIKVLTNDDFTAAHLNFKINTATTFEFSLPASKALPSGSKYVATPHPLNDSKFIMLRLTERVDKTETIDYSAYELAYQELATDGYIEDKRPQNQSALNLMKIALDGSNWELNNVNVSGTATTNFYYVDRLSAISKVVDLLGGEIVFYIEIQGNAISGRYMDYLARQGADTSKVFASGSNLLTVERQSDTSNIYTAILPRGKGKEIDNGDADTPDGYGRRINIADVEWKKSSGNPLDKPKGSIVLSDPDATTEWGQINGNARLLLQTYDDIDDINVLINSAYKTLQSVNHPQIQYSATVADVGGLSLGDTVLIMRGDRDLSYKTRVFEVKYDLLAPDQTELSLGDDLSSNSITSQINSLNAVADTTSSQTQWTINQIGRPSTTFGNTEPANSKVGDVFFKELPDGGTEIYRWNGDIWELLASPTTADDIATAVDDAVTQAKAHTDEVKQSLSTDIATAKSQATSQANAAEANAKSEAVSQFNQAQSALSAAKTDLTNSIASEASERNQAVAAANSQAQTYANQAKADALNTIAKEVTDRQNAVSALDTKATNAVNQAKSDINDTIKAISIGGRNLILGTETDTTWTAGTSNWSFNVIATGLKPNQTYTFSAEVTLGNTDQKNTTLSLYDAPIGQWLASTDYFKADGERDHWTFTVPSTVDTPTASLIIYAGKPGSTGGKSVTYHHIKLETGNIATDWTPAPEDIVLDYTTKDNQIKETITQYQTTNDGKVIKAQTDATTALGQVATKVSQTDYDQKTGDLSTKINDVKQTADSSAQTIADIKTADGKQDARMSEIENTASGLKSTVSDISTAQGKQSVAISTLQQRADGFDATVTKVNNLSVGGRNYYILSTSVLGWLNNGNIVGSAQDKTSDFIKVISTSLVISIFSSGINSYGNDFLAFYDSNKVFISQIGVFGNYPPDNGHLPDPNYKIINLPNNVAYVRYQGATNATYKVEFGTIPTDWTPAPEDVDSATAKAQLTADNASLAINNYKTDADGRIRQAQSDIHANADAITKTVSKTVYDQNTGDILQAISKAQSTADGAVSTVGNYKTSNDGRVEAAESAISQNADAIALKVAKTDYDNNNSQLNTRFTKVEATANGASTTVGELKTTVNNLGQVNQLFNTEFSPDFAGWINGNIAPFVVDGSYNGSIRVRNTAKNDGNRLYSELISVQGVSVVSTSVYNDNWSLVRGYDENKKLIGELKSNYVSGQNILNVMNGISIPSTVYYIDFGVQSGVNSYVSQPMLVFSSSVGTYVQGNYNNNAALAQVKITADGVSNFVRDSSGNISSDFQTALSKTSIITGSTLASSIQTQTSSQISSALTDNNGKIISLINQDSSGVQIAGKNLAITADTTVDGNFWAKQVNAIQVNASNITAGTLNASNVNIINLNVNSLTGNVSNFIQSNWNGEYSSTKISSTGMQIGGFTANGFDTIFDKTGITFETTDARYGYAIAHYGTDTITNSSGKVMARGMEIRTGNENGIGFDYFAIKSPGANNLELGKTTNAGHVSIAVVPDTNLMPILNKGVTILDDLYVGKVNGAKAGGLFSVLAGRTIHIPTSMNNNGTVGGWLDITL